MKHCKHFLFFSQAARQCEILHELARKYFRTRFKIVHFDASVQKTGDLRRGVEKHSCNDHPLYLHVSNFIFF